MKIYADRPAEFWTAMGPFFASKDARKEMPFLHDAPGMVWFIEFAGEQVAAFGSAEVDVKSVGHLRNLYVAPAQRANGYASALMQARLEYLREQGVQRVRTTRRRTKISPFAENHGFNIVGKDGAYDILEAQLHPIDEPTRAAGYKAAEAIILSGKKRLQVIKPTMRQREQFQANWDSFMVGWMQRVRERKTELHEWQPETEAAS